MLVEIITLTKTELKDILTEAYKVGYIEASMQWKAQEEAQKDEPKCGVLLAGVKELKKYLEYRGYWKGSISTLSKVAPQLLDEKEKRGQRLAFRTYCIDHAFKNGFRFKPPGKVKASNLAC